MVRNYSFDHLSLCRQAERYRYADRYEEEHIPLLSKVPGWMSSVRGKMVLQSEESDPHLPKYGAFHRYSAGNGLGTSAEFKHATSTPWREKIIGIITNEGKKARSQWVFKQT
jgi:hypothetical protein